MDTMGSETEKKPSAAFDADAASAMVKELRASYGSGTTRSYGWRISQLGCLLRLTEDNGEEIARALCSDLSKPELESYVYEISMLKNSINLALKELKKWMLPNKAKTTLTTFPSSAEIVSEPLGVVLVISAWNYPFLLSLDPVVGAIAAGNAVVLKPSEIAPASSALLAKLVGENMDGSAIRVIEGAVAETTALLEQKWDKICYTGNSRVGRIIMTAAAKNLTPVLLELGGKCPVVVDSNINLKVSCRRIIMGKWGCNNGQACISPDYIIATKEYAPKLIDALKKELERFFGKNALESNDLSRIVNYNHFSRLTKLLDEDKVSDKVVHGGERDQSKLKIAPTILLDVSRDSLIMNEEIFGPLLPILTLDMSTKDELIGKVYGYFAAIGEFFDLRAKVDKLEDSFDIINSGMKPLAAYLFTSDKKFRERFVMKVSAGGLVVNDTAIHLAVPSLPFGGVGDSGLGSYHGKFSFDAFSHKKAVLYRGFAADADIRYPPYTKTKVRLLQALVSGSFVAIICALLGRS